MKSTTTILSSLLLALVSASPIARAPSQIDVTGFTAQTEPNGDGASISFTVSIPSVSIEGTSCAYSDATSLGRLPDVPLTPCASSAALRFQFRQDPAQYPGAGEGRYRLVVVYAPGEAGVPGVAGYHEWDPSDFVASGGGGSEDLVYEGVPDFTLTPA
ncbi:hypothetical protein F4809DRAFT_600125 [Biscogniauxia mediterranea]|nr:hypothetical protein F4809DRAFT_600125 [Biscogniauxia mediterranea]